MSLGSWHGQRTPRVWSREWVQDLNPWLQAGAEGFCFCLQQDRVARAINSLVSDAQTFLRAVELWLSSHFNPRLAMLVDPIACFSSALQGRTHLPGPSQKARALSVATDMPLSQGRDCKTSFIQIFTNCYWWLIDTCFKFYWAWYLFALLFMWLPQSVPGVAEFREVTAKETIWGI